MNYITIIKGDDTNFLEDQFIVINFKTDFSMSGFMATFTLDNVTLTYGDLSEKKLEIVLSKEITSNLKIGKQYGELKLVDTKKRIRTVSSVIPFLVKNGVNEQITYINNSLNVVTHINDTTLEIIVETAGIAKTEAEKILAGCNQASKVAQNCSNISQTLSLKMDEQVNIFTTKQNQLNIAVDNAVERCEQNLVDMSNAESTALNNIYNATANLDKTVSKGLEDITSSTTNTLSIISDNKASAIYDINNLKETFINDITSLKSESIISISETRDEADKLISNGLSNLQTGLNNIDLSRSSALTDILNSKNQAIQDISSIAGVDFSAFALSSDLKQVSFTGDYNDLINRPYNLSEFYNDTSFVTYQDISSKVDSSMLAPVAFYGEYSLLTNTPTDVSFFYNDAGYVTYQDILDKVDASNLSEVAFNGDYASLNNTPQNLSYFNNDVGYLSEHQDISGKENILKDIKSLAASGTISLTDNSINKITATGTVTFSLPSVVSTKYHQILVLLTMSTVRTINLGTTHYFTGEAPDLTKAGLYNIIYEYNGTYWVVGAIYKGTS